MYLKLFLLNLGHLLLPIFYYPGCVWYIPVLDHTLYGIIAFLILVYNDTVLDSIKPRKEGEDDGGMMGGIEQVKVMGVGVTEAVDIGKTVKGEIENLPLKDAVDSVKTVTDDYQRGDPEGKTFDGFASGPGSNLLMAPPILGYPVPPVPPQIFGNYAVPNKKAPLNRVGAVASHPGLESDKIPRPQYSLDEMRSFGNPSAIVPTISSTLEDVNRPLNYHPQSALFKPADMGQKPNTQADLPDPLTPSTIEISSTETIKLPSEDEAS